MKKLARSPKLAGAKIPRGERRRAWCRGLDLQEPRASLPRASLPESAVVVRAIALGSDVQPSHAHGAAGGASAMSEEAKEKTARRLFMLSLIQSFSSSLSMQASNQIWLDHFNGDFAAHARVMTRVSMFSSVFGFCESAVVCPSHLTTVV